jgi:serine/threonine-protein kinase HipA
MVFNIVARNQDDHVKNIAFLMDKQGRWSLAPAFDVTYSFNPSGSWTATHQMLLNGKRDDFTLADFQACAKSALLKRGRAATILEEVTTAVAHWPEFAAKAQVADEWHDQIQNAHRLVFPAK